MADTAQLIEEIKKMSVLELSELIKALVDEAPKPIKEGVDREEGERLKGEIEEAGGSVELK